MRTLRIAALAAASLSFGVGSAPLALALPSGGTGPAPDCDGDGIPDEVEIAQGLAYDCNTNGVPDDCDIANGTSQDCNEDGLPDECLYCPRVDIVFVMDTSLSMADESMALCMNIAQILTTLHIQGIVTSATILGITAGATEMFPCLQNSVANLLGPTVPGTGAVLDDHEDWGPAVTIVAERFGWAPGAVRIIVPLSDEGAEDGNPCEDPGPDRAAIDHAITYALANGVRVSPIAGTGSSQCVIDLASGLASATGGVAFLSTDPTSDLAGAILEIVLGACTGHTDCNRNGIPDECEPDCNDNGIPDACDGGCPPIDLRCAEFNRFANLTQNDTLTLITNVHNPQAEQGYVYAYAVDGRNQPIAFDRLIGQLLIVSGLQSFEYSVNPLDFRAVGPHRSQTDLDGDGIRDLNGVEYEKAPGRLLFPRFIGQVDGTPQSELVLISLAGGTEFDTTVDFLIYNDNEVAFSGEHTFFCWDKLRLLQISSAFGNQFLAEFSGDAPNEQLGTREYGWIRLKGAIASSSATSIVDPAVYGMYVERVGSHAAADLPFEICARSGHLLPRTVQGDNEEQGPPVPEDCTTSISRRHPASLLLYPEFNNRVGVVSVLTVTNTSPNESVRVHFKYIGRYGAP